jgi:uncharacterized protein (TIGR02452 family)
MGRTEKSQGLAPPAVRKDIRAKQARRIVNKIPSFLASNARARRGADASELIANPECVFATVGSGDSKSKSEGRDDGAGGEDAGYVKRKGQGRRKVTVVERDGEGDGEGKGKKGKSRRNNSLDEAVSKLSLQSTTPPRKERSIRIITTDTLTAAHLLTFSPQQNPHPKLRKTPNTCILNMASPLRPGGGVLTGATSQEEFLCARTTLLPSLKETYYRLPELGGIYTPDVLVFRSSLPLGNSAGGLPACERWFVDVVSAGMLRFPELEGGEEERRLGKKDREAVEGKIRAVLRICERKGGRKLVLGAWGCGAYGNPVVDVANAFHNVLSGSLSLGKKGNKERAETWPNLEEVIFAIPNRKMATDFAHAFSNGIEVEAGPGAADGEEEEDEEDKVAEELRTKIQEMESQLGTGRVWNPDLKARMGSILDGLKAQLRDREGTPEASTQNGEDERESDEVESQDDGDHEDGPKPHSRNHMDMENSSDEEAEVEVLSYGSSDVGCFHPNSHDW